MMKHIPFFLAAAVLLASCSGKEERTLCTDPVHVSVGNFDISVDDSPATKAAVLVSEAGAVKSITVVSTDERPANVTIETLDVSYTFTNHTAPQPHSSQ